MMRERLILMSASADGRRMEPWGALEPMRRRKHVGTFESTP